MFSIAEFDFNFDFNLICHAEIGSSRPIVSHLMYVVRHDKKMFRE